MNECTDVSLHERGIIGVWIEIGGGSVFCGVVRQKARQTSSQTFVPGISRHSFPQGMLGPGLGSGGGDLGAWDHEGIMHEANPGRAEQMQSSWTRGRGIIGGCN